MAAFGRVLKRVCRRRRRGHEGGCVSAVLGLHHVAIAACNVDAALRFYNDAASLRVWPAAAALGLQPDAAWLCSDNMGLCIVPAAPGQAPQRRPVCEAGITHLCLQTPDIDAVQRRFAKAHASFHGAPIDLGTGYLYCYARDPEFNVSEIECVPPVWAEPQPWVAHVNIASPDLERLVAFYTALLGGTAVRSPRLRNDARLDAIADLPDVQLRMAWLQTGNAQIELMQYLHPATTSTTGRRQPGVPGYAWLALEVVDLEAAVAQLRAAGGQARTPRPGAFSCHASDPDGNSLRLLDLQAPALRRASIQALREPRITQRFATARDALLKAP